MRGEPRRAVARPLSGHTKQKYIYKSFSHEPARYIYLHIRICIHIHTYICIYTNIYIYTCTYAHIHTHIHILMRGRIGTLVINTSNTLLITVDHSSWGKSCRGTYSAHTRCCPAYRPNDINCPIVESRAYYTPNRTRISSEPGGRGG
jgi:hypothetical protein